MVNFDFVDAHFLIFEFIGQKLKLLWKLLLQLDLKDGAIFFFRLKSFNWNHLFLSWSP